ncbi:class I SAM-dependent DNA methyltransferase [Brevundimonas lutea]|uniref:class I SAM-dependent DNA methyltransferase n=1 Tax=Brevundimonas lutea TaxID=2293980 RepID=UPI000F03096A|nr:DNA methyltransferase [Brevundimonas lutea]
MDVEAFIERWRRCDNGSERGNAAMYLREMMDALGLPPPEPSSDADYRFERSVPRRLSDRPGPGGFIDLYKDGCFVLEAKQSRIVRDGPLSREDREALACPSRSRRAGWDNLMQSARTQALGYVQALSPDRRTPPFILLCDVANVFEVWADFTGTGRGYDPFPDRATYRIAHEDLSDPDIQTRLRAIWTDPASLNPAAKAAAVTRNIMDDLAGISRRLEQRGYAAEDVAHFLMRCCFTAFCGDIGLFPKAGLIALLQDCHDHPRKFVPQIEDFWRRLDAPSLADRFNAHFDEPLPYVNGGLFSENRAFPLSADDIRLLIEASARDWRKVDPAIFGALLEHALEPAERRRLGAHYTPRVYVERLVELTIMEPLRARWNEVMAGIEQAREDDNVPAAVKLAKAFRAELAAVRVLDPACGTGNFLYVAMDRMQRLEAEVLDVLQNLGEPGDLLLDGVHPANFLGLEINPRAVVIAQMVLWIGFYQNHFRTRSGRPREPILQRLTSIQENDAIVDADRPGRRPDWPDAEFIIGNPPFTGGKDLRRRLGAAYVSQLADTWPEIGRSADVAMYFWARAAELTARPGSRVRRFGFVTTNSIVQPFQRGVVNHWLSGSPPVSILHAVPDHAWVTGETDSAAVRIAMTVVAAGRHAGVLQAVEPGDDRQPEVLKRLRTGQINADLTIGVDLTRCMTLAANRAVCSPGVKLHGEGFLVERARIGDLGVGRRHRLDRRIRTYRNGRDLNGRSRGLLALDMGGLDHADVRDRYPEVYQHLAETVRDERRRQADSSPTPDAQAYATAWWLFGKPRDRLRRALEGLPRYIATPETSRHRLFHLLNGDILPDNSVIVIADDDAATFAVLSSRHHAAWALASGGRMGKGNDPRYTKSRCFDTFPFPALSETTALRLRAAGEALDSWRRRIAAERPDITLTTAYNLLEAGRAGRPLSLEERALRDAIQITLLADLHDEIDRATAEAYGWSPAMDATAVIAALAALNAERVDEERRGLIRWRRPAIQTAASRGRPVSAQPELTPGHGSSRSGVLIPFPTSPIEQPLAIEAVIRAAETPLDAIAVSRRFRRSRQIESRVGVVLGTLHRYSRIHRLDDGRYQSRATI